MSYSSLSSSSRNSPRPTATQTLDVLEPWTQQRLGAGGYERLDASTPAAGRHAALQRFAAPGSPARLLLMSTDVCGLGTDLPGVSLVLFYDSDWHPKLDLQVCF